MDGLAIRFAFSLCLLTASLSSPLVFASYERGNCENLLLGEFGHLPNDSREGLITNRVQMTPESLIAAYQVGIFPWEMTPDGNAVWHSPPNRGVLIFDEIEIPRSDRKFIRRALEDPDYEVTFDKAFNEVMMECAEMVRWREIEPGKVVPDGQWISQEFIRNYTALFAQGHAHSVEVWHNGILVAGLYGTFIDGVFAGESMFHKESDATKIALYSLIERLKSNGHTFMDTQQAKNADNPLAKQRSLVVKWNARTIPREDFYQKLRTAQSENKPF